MALILISGKGFMETCIRYLLIALYRDLQQSNLKEDIALMFARNVIPGSNAICIYFINIDSVSLVFKL